MQGIQHIKGERVTEAFIRNAERIARVWKMQRYRSSASLHAPTLMLEEVVENFICEIGWASRGASGSPWSRTTGILRVYPFHSRAPVDQEFDSLKNCLLEGATTLSASNATIELINESIGEAQAWVHTFLSAWAGAIAPNAPGSFGGIVVECLTRPAALANAALVSAEVASQATALSSSSSAAAAAGCSSSN
jgi:hypothetical protein